MTHHKLSMPVRPLAALALCLAALGCTAPDEPSENVVAAAPAALWVNGDFESNTTANVPPTGWTIEARRNFGITDTRPSPQTLASLNLQAGGTANTVIVRGAPESQSDPHLGAGASLRYPRYGNSAAVVNYNPAGALGDQYNANIMRQTMTVALGDIDPIDNAVHVRFAIAPVLQNPSHPYNQQPYYYVELRNITRSNAILYQDFNTSAQTGVPWKISNSIYYTDWQLVDISPGNSLLAVGDQVELVVVAAGCSQSGHWGRVYVDGVNATIPGIYTWATGPSAVNAGSTITYTVNYRNGGSAPTTNTILAFETPPGTNFNAVSLGAACTNPGAGNAGLVSCSLGTLAPGATGSFTVTVNVPVLTAVGTVLTAGNYYIDADVVSPLLGPKVQTTVTALVAYADVSVTKTDNSAARGLGTPTSYTIVVSNAGPNAATNVQVVDTMPAQLTGVTWTCTPSALATCTGAGSGNINQTVTIPSGGNVTYTVNATIVGSGATSVSNTASATVNTQSDPSTSNNSATDTTALGALRTLSVSKTGALGGSIVSTPAAINCGTSCSSASAQFLDGSTVILTAAAVPNATFVGWGGACSGTATTCTLTVSADTNVSATFLPPPFLSINGGGTQSTVVSTAFGTPLSVRVADANDNAIPNVTVTFTVPGSGASATLTTLTATTNAMGIATVNATANTVAGTYNVTANVSGAAAPLTFALTNNPGPAATVTVSGGGVQSTTVNTAFGAPFQVRVLDGFGNPRVGDTVTYTRPTSGASVTLSGLTATTNATGYASVTGVANTETGSYVVTATTASLTPATFNLTNNAGAVSTVTQTGEPQSAQVAQMFGSALGIILRDQYGNGVPGIVVSYAANGTTANATLSAASSITNASGLAAVNATANNAAGSYTVTATIPGQGTRTWNLTNTPGPVTQVTQSGTPQSATVATGYAAPLVLTLRDALNNPVPGVTITYATSGSPTTPNVTLSQTSVTTNASGTATVSASANNFAGPVTVTATIPGAGTRTFSLTNTPGAAAAVAQTGTPQSTTVATAYASPLALVVTDALGNPIQGLNITYTASGVGGANVSLSATTATTNASGAASITATANNTAGAVTVTATIPGIGTRTFSLTNTPGAVTQVTQTGTPQSQTVGGNAYGQPLELTLRDALSNPVPGVTITYSTSGTSTTPNVSLSSGSVTTNAAGVASVTATSNDIAGPVTVTATIPGVGTRSFSLTNTPGAATQAAQSGSPQSQTVGGIAYGAPLVLTVRDALDNPVPGVTITYATAGAGGANVALSATSATTDASGVASITATSNNLAGLVTVTATIPGIGTRTFALTNTPDVAASLVVHDGGTQSAEVSTAFATALAVRVTDQFGNVRAGDTVTFTLPTSAANATLSSTTALTDASGIAQVTATANTTAGSYTVTASAGSLGPVSFDLTNTPGVPYSAIADTGASQTTIVNTAFAEALSLTVRDQYGNPLPGVTVVLSVPGADASAVLSETSPVTDANGRISVTATANTVAGSYDVVASVLGITANTIFALTNTHDAPASLLVTTGDDQSATVDEAFGTALEVRVTDQFGNPIAGETVTFTAPGTGASAVLSATTVTTDADGRASVTAQANTVAGSYEVTASSGSLAPVELSLENDASTPFSANADSGASQSTVVDTAFGEPLALTVRDAFGNPLPGITVTFTVPSADASAVLTTLTVVTDVNGQVSVPAAANTVAGPYTVEASVPGIAAPTVFALTNSPDVPAHLDIVEGDDQSAVVDEAFTTALTVRVTDRFGNPISGESVTFAAPATDASAVLSGTTVTTDADGRASVSAQANTVAGTYDVTVSSGVLAPVAFSLENEVSVPFSITIDSGASQMAVVGEAFTDPLTLTVRDAFGNVLPGVTVTFTVPSTDASATLTTLTATTDENGQVTVNATANTVAGMYEVEARVSGITDPAVFTLVNLVSVPSRISVLGGGEQSAVVDTDFAEPLTVLVTDENGNAVADVEVTFTVPSSDATAVLTSLTATTDANGHATVDAKAGTIVGAYQVTAATAFSTTPATFELSNTPGAAATITPMPGSSPQSAQVGTPFTNPLAVTVVDAFGNPVPGVTVTFTVPASGPTAEVTTVTVVTDENGVASLPASASTQAGAYVVTATTAGVQDPATFELENLVGTPATISILSGGEQSTLATTSFGEAIVIEVLDVYGNPVPGAVIDVALPTSGASATGSAAQIVTDENGVARIELVANAVAGTYTVSISVENGDAPVLATLTNETVSTTLTLTTEQDHALLGGRFEVTATVTSPTGTPSGIVRFFAGEVSLGEAVLDENGVAVLRIDATVIGELQVHAEYVADLPFVSTTSEPIVLTVDGGAVFGGAVCSASPGQRSTSMLPLALLGLVIVLVRRRAVRS